MEIHLRTIGDVAVIEICGQLTFETAPSFRKLPMMRLSVQNVVFNFEKLRFVGSNGIGVFMDCIFDFTEKCNLKAKFCSVSIEFRKLLLARQIQPECFFETEMGAVASFSNINVAPQVVVEVLEEEELFSENSSTDSEISNVVPLIPVSENN